MGRSFRIWGQIEAVFNISKYSKWPPFWARDKPFYRKLYRKLNSHAHFRHFELLIDALTQILTEIYQFQNLTYFVTRWRHQWRHEYIFYIIVIISSWYLCTESLMIPSLLVFLVIMKNVVISFMKEYRGPTLRPPCDVIDDVIIIKILFWHNSGRSFHIWVQIEAVFNISKCS